MSGNEPPPDSAGSAKLAFIKILASSSGLDYIYDFGIADSVIEATPVEALNEAVVESPQFAPHLGERFAPSL